MFKYCRVALSSNLKRTIFPSSEIGSDVIGGIFSAAGLFFFLQENKIIAFDALLLSNIITGAIGFPIRDRVLYCLCVCVCRVRSNYCDLLWVRDPWPETAPAGSATTTSDADDACLSRRPQGPPHTFTTLTGAGSHLGNRLPAFQVTRQVVITTTASRFLQRDEYGNYDCVDEGNRARILKYSQRGLKRREKDWE